MLDVSWQEILVIAAVAVVVIGPKDMPTAIRAVSRWAAKARALAREFQQGIDEVVREAELQDVQKQIEDVRSLDLEGEIAKTVDPTGEVAKTLDLSGVEKSLGDSARALAHEPAAGEAPAGADSRDAPAGAPAPAPDAPKPTGTG